MDVSVQRHRPLHSLPICEVYVYLDTQFSPRGEHDEPTEPAYILQTSIQINHPIIIMYHQNRYFLECVPHHCPIT